MASAFRSSSSGGGAVATTRATTLPSGVRAGDLLLLGVLTEGSDVTSAITAGAGWTKQIALFDAAESWLGAVFSCVYDGSAAAPTVTWGGASRFATFVMGAYIDAVVQEVRGTQQSTASASVVAPAVTLTEAGVVVVFAFNDQGQSTAPASSGLTRRVDIFEGAFYDKTAAAGSTGALTLRQSGSVRYIAETVAIQPPVAPSGTTVKVNVGGSAVECTVNVNVGGTAVPVTGITIAT